MTFESLLKEPIRVCEVKRELSRIVWPVVKETVLRPSYTVQFSQNLCCNAVARQFAEKIKVLLHFAIFSAALTF